MPRTSPSRALIRKPKPGVYIASKLHHHAKWLDLRKEWPEFRFTARWPAKVARGRHDTPQNASAFWQEDEADIMHSQALLVYGEPEDELRGALVEVGMALINFIPVVACGHIPGTWRHHPRVSWVPTLEEARGALRLAVRRP